MTLIQSVFALLLPLSFGYLTWELIQPRNSRSHLESFGFSFPIGMGAVAILLLAMAHCRLLFNRTVLISMMTAAIAVLAIIRIYRPSTPPALDKKLAGETSPTTKWIQRIFAGIIVIELVIISA